MIEILELIKRSEVIDGIGLIELIESPLAGAWPPTRNPAPLKPGGMAFFARTPICEIAPSWKPGGSIIAPCFNSKSFPPLKASGAYITHRSPGALSTIPLLQLMMLLLSCHCSSCAQYYYLKSRGVFKYIPAPKT